MAQGHNVDTTWMWHPAFSEEVPSTAGLFVHFRRSLNLPYDSPAPSSLKIRITADTRYRLYVNHKHVCYGPVKGDQMLWFFDEVDIAPFLKPGANILSVRVLRFFYATQYATSFPRLPTGGLRIITSDPTSPWARDIQSSSSWQCAIDTRTTLRIDEPEDHFLHIYERVAAQSPGYLTWVPARVLEFQSSTGNSSPWNLSPRLIPRCRSESVPVLAIHNVKSSISSTDWASVLQQSSCSLETGKNRCSLPLNPGSCHQIDIEVPSHTTGFVKFCFDRPRGRCAAPGSSSTLRVRYAESYEDMPRLVPYLRTKWNRRDTSRDLFGPEDIYHFQGSDVMNGSCDGLGEHKDEQDEEEENFEPFHFRTFRFIRLMIDVGPSSTSGLVFKGIGIESTTYPLDVQASFQTGTTTESVIQEEEEQQQQDVYHQPANTVSSFTTTNRLWTTSVRTLTNCMHDCYEDCPLYEQLQYAMDTRSSALFTYYLSADDRLARQAITQLHSSFNPILGLTCSRAPSHRPQMIPHFSLFWVCMVADHLRFFGDLAFTRGFLPVVDAVLGYFDNLVDPEIGLVRVDTRPGLWHFTDWVEEWRPYGVPAPAERSGFSTYTNNLYAYTLRQAAGVVEAAGRRGVADEYRARAGRVVEAICEHCFDGEFFTDGRLASTSAAAAAAPLGNGHVNGTNGHRNGDHHHRHHQHHHGQQGYDGYYSQHNQVWAVLSGAAYALKNKDQDFPLSLIRATLEDSGPPACLAVKKGQRKFIQTSIAMSHYTLRAISQVGGSLYDEIFHGEGREAGGVGGGFWKPWTDQLARNLTTWEEDAVSQRSDCHAWGCAPVYEFLAEVVGLRPGILGDSSSSSSSSSFEALSVSLSDSESDYASSSFASSSPGCDVDVGGDVSLLNGNGGAAGCKVNGFGRRGSGGWVAGFTFQPRISLFPKLRATVPLRRSKGSSIYAEDGDADLLAHVSWEEDEDDSQDESASKKKTARKIVRIRLESRACSTVEIPVFVKIPGQAEHQRVLLCSASSKGFEFRV